MSALPEALQAKLDQPGLASSAARKLEQAPASKGSIYDTTVPKTAGASLKNKARPHGHRWQHDSRPSTQSGGKNSNQDGAICPNPTDHIAWDRAHPFSLMAVRHRKLAQRAKESAYKATDPDHPEPVLDSVRRAQSLGSAASDCEGEAQQRPNSRHLS